MDVAREKPVMLRLLSSSVTIASRAGLEVRRIMKGGKLGVVDKGIEDYQTEADRTAQRLIVASLSKYFPKCKIVGEEDLIENKEEDERLIVDSFDSEVLTKSLPKEYEDLREEDLTVWVDPLDGTAEFVKGMLDHVTILIGISVNGKSIAGVIHQPFYGYSKDEPNKELKGRTIWGVVNMGCFGVDKKILPENKLIITTTSSHGNKNIDEAISSLNPDEIIRVGGAGNKVLLVIEGRAHSYVFASNGSKRWDTGAPEAVLHSLGGCLTDVFGKNIDYQHDSDYQNYLGIIASNNPETQKRMLDRIPEDVKTRLLEVQKKNLKSKY